MNFKKIIDKKILYKQFYNTWFNITELNLKKYDVNIEM